MKAALEVGGKSSRISSSKLTRETKFLIKKHKYMIFRTRWNKIEFTEPTNPLTQKRKS